MGVTVSINPDSTNVRTKFPATCEPFTDLRVHLRLAVCSNKWHRVLSGGRRADVVDVLYAIMKLTSTWTKFLLQLSVL